MVIKKVNDPHDRFLRRTISDLDNAKTLFRANLPGWVARSLDLDALKFESELSLSDELDKMLIDAVYSVPVVGHEQPAFLVLLVEHKSDPYDIKPAKMERYRMAQMDEIARKRKLKTKPLVIPYLIYHGKETYTGPLSVPETVEGPQTLIDYAFAYSFYLIDLTVTPDEALLEQAVMGVSLLILKHQDNPEFQKAFHKIFLKLKSMIGEVDLADLLTTISTYLNTVMSKASYETVAEIAIKYLGAGEGGVMITAREAYYQEGKEEGREEGKLELVKAMLAQNMPFEQIAKITNWSPQRLIALQEEMS